jgi:hypothetical protein
MEATAVAGANARTETARPAPWRTTTSSRAPSESRRFGEAVQIYLLSRVLVVVCAVVSVTLVDSVPARGPWPSVGGPRVAALQALGRWDGAWYLDIARHGYHPIRFGAAGHASEAFFPGFPLLVRGLTFVTGAPALTAGILANLVLGAVAAVLVWRLVSEVAGPDAARRSTTLLCFSPGAYVLTMTYSEALFLAATVAALLMLVRRQWWAAGAFTAVAGLTRSNGAALVAAGLVVAAVAIWRRRDWSALAAPLLGSTGTLAYFAYLYIHTGRAFEWFRVERLGWGDRLAPVSGFVHHLRLLHAPSLRPNGLVEPVWALFTAVAVVGVVLLVRWRPPLPVVAYGLVSTAFIAASYQVGLRPRMLLTAFPIVLAFGVQTEGRRYRAVLAACIIGLVVSSVLTFGTRATIP